MELKEKDRAGKPKPKGKLVDLAKQPSRKMKEKYIQELKERPKGAKGETEQATEQVEQSGYHAASKLTDAAGWAVRQGREYAVKKAKKAASNIIPPTPPEGDPTGASIPDTAFP